jgi:hypothetical protein
VVKIGKSNRIYRKGLVERQVIFPIELFQASYTSVAFSP